MPIGYFVRSAVALLLCAVMGCSLSRSAPWSGAPDRDAAAKLANPNRNPFKRNVDQLRDTPHAARNTVQHGGEQSAESGLGEHDPETRALIERELQDASPEEREQLLSDFKGLEPEMVKRILRMRRMVHQLGHKEPSSKLAGASPPKDKSHESTPTIKPDRRAQLQADYGDYDKIVAGAGHSADGSSPSRAGSASAGLGTANPWDDRTSSRSVGREFGNAGKLDNHDHLSQPDWGQRTKQSPARHSGATPGTQASNSPTEAFHDGRFAAQRSIQSGQLTPAGHTIGSEVESPESDEYFAKTGRSGDSRDGNPGEPRRHPNSRSALARGANPAEVDMWSAQSTIRQDTTGAVPRIHGRSQMSSSSPSAVVRTGIQGDETHGQRDSLPEWPAAEDASSGRFDSESVDSAQFPFGDEEGSRWHEELERLISYVEADATIPLATERDGEGSSREGKWRHIEKQVFLRMLYLMAGQPERTFEPIRGIDPADQEFWQQMFWAIANYFDSQSMPDPQDRATQTVIQLRAAVQRLQERARLQLRNVCFCHRISSYGNYEKFPEDAFSPGQPVLVYAEVNNFTSESTADGQYRTILRSTIEIFRAGPNGDLVERIEFPPTEDLCQSYRRDYFHSYEFTIPQRISLGEHVLKLTVEDQLSHKVASYSTKFTVK